MTGTDAAVRSIHLMARGSLAEFAEVVHPDAVNREAVAEPAACRGRGPRHSTRPRSGCAGSSTT
ncbi:hypothetical protein [Pseudonocardia abyssalis]|uniref:hypothetical protein n=1 Tax=Pseudonocardia abyssalis TaxID=2792008 RepID=UPI001CED8AFD|nr:hypothetical protein [Pseudonocardia abyssalis]